MTARKRGRPAADGPRVAVRLTDAQAKALERVAAKAGVPLSTYLREAALQKAGLAALGIAGEAARIAG
ncbi:MAG: ribbon-helix-helix domain-containing protein [Polyangiaceae bacterium]|nr:ribbon-helix-helix domain-containing protein [Polyangiaceae bacterium]